MIEQITSFFAAVKNTSPTILFGVSIGSGTLLFASDQFVEALGLLGFVSENTVTIGVVILAATSLLVAHIITQMRTRSTS